MTLAGEGRRIVRRKGRRAPSPEAAKQRLRLLSVAPTVPGADLVRARPLTSLLLAAGTGFLLGRSEAARRTAGAAAAAYLRSTLNRLHDRADQRARAPRCGG